MRYLSLFDGIGAASCAWEPLGWECVGVSEIEPFPIAVTSHHRPHVPHLGDVTKITEDHIKSLGRIDLIVGGFPCQDLSVAGKRAGLRNEDGTATRSGLFFDAMRVVRWAREHCGLRWLLIENVPGLYSSNKGRDFAAVVGEMVGTEFDVPGDGWRNAGVAVGPEGLCEWATLDAQFFNLAQRRVRVFAVADFGDWAGRSPLFLERHSLLGNPAPRREAGQRPAGAIAARSFNGGAGGRPEGAAAGHFVEVSPTLRAGGNKTGGDRPPGTDVDTCESLIPVPHADISPALKARDSKGPSSDGDGDGDGAILVPMVAHSLRGEGFDVSEEGTGRGTPLVPVAYRIHGEHSTAMTGNGIARVADLCEVSRCLDSSGGYATNQGGNIVAQPVAFHPTQDPISSKDHGADAGEIAPTLRSMGHDGSHANGRGQVAVAFAHQAAGAQTTLGYDPEAGTTQTLGANQTPAVAIALRGRDGGATAEVGDEVGNTLRASGGGGDKAHVLAAMQVRRLTPRECERLQGFPDDYTLITVRGKPAADGPRYKALGNSMAVPVMAWIGERIQLATDQSTQEAA